jgi:hypothetical protein
MHELEARIKRGSVIQHAILFTVACGFIYYKKGDTIFQKVQTLGEIIIPVLFVFLSICSVFCWLKFFDSTIQFAIKHNGIYVKKNIFPFSGCALIRYSDIEYFYLQIEETKGGLIFSLILGFHEAAGKEKKVEIGKWDKSVDEICELLEYYASKHKFRNSGVSNING